MCIASKKCNVYYSVVFQVFILCLCIDYDEAHINVICAKGIAWYIIIV
jgi:hypothetical protein